MRKYRRAYIRHAATQFYEDYLSVYQYYSFFFTKLAAWNNHPGHGISNHSFLSSDIDNRDFDGGRNTSLVTFPRQRETSTTGKEITFHRATYPASGVYGRGTANDVRGRRRKRMASTIQHIFGSFGVSLRRACHRMECHRMEREKCTLMLRAGCIR